jgi:hypothetical protein
MPNKVALNAVMATLAAAMRHSPAFDIVAQAGEGQKSRSSIQTAIALHSRQRGCNLYAKSEGTFVVLPKQRS